MSKTVTLPFSAKNEEGSFTFNPENAHLRIDHPSILDGFIVYGPKDEEGVIELYGLVDYVYYYLNNGQEKEVIDTIVEYVENGLMFPSYEPTMREEIDYAAYQSYCVDKGIPAEPAPWEN